jgi:hypothetical protein
MVFVLRIEPGQSAVSGTPAKVEPIWPTSGPSGIPVQVIASAFPANTEVSIGLGPVSSQFGEVAKGTTDAEGLFSVPLPVEGKVGMARVFAVAAEGQLGIISPDLFQATG